MISDYQAKNGARALTAIAYLLVIGIFEAVTGKGSVLITGSVLCGVIVVGQHMLQSIGKRSWFWFLISTSNWFTIAFALYVTFGLGIYRVVTGFTIYKLLASPLLIFFAWRMMDGVSKLTSKTPQEPTN